MQQTPTNTTAVEVVHGLSNHEYHQLPSISKSGLDLIHKAPALFHHRRTHPTPPTPAMRMGTLVHSAILEPDTLFDGLIVAPNCDRRTSAGKAEWEAFLIAAEGRELVTVEEIENLRKIRDAVWAHPAGRTALGMLREVETSIFWNHDNIACRCRPDGILTNGVILDVKTTRDASADQFVRSVVQYRYHVQAAFYSDGYEAAFGEPPKGFLFLAVETDEPHLTACYVASKEMILRGRADYERDLATYARCLEAGQWPGLSNEPIKIDLPKWA